MFKIQVFTRENMTHTYFWFYFKEFIKFRHCNVNIEQCGRNFVNHIVNHVDYIIKSDMTMIIGDLSIPEFMFLQHQLSISLTLDKLTNIKYVNPNEDIISFLSEYQCVYVSMRSSTQLSNCSKTTPIRKPVRTAVASEPVRTAVASEPVRTAVASEPVRTAVASEPVRTTVASEPEQINKSASFYAHEFMTNNLSLLNNVKCVNPFDISENEVKKIIKKCDEKRRRKRNEIEEGEIIRVEHPRKKVVYDDFSMNRDFVSF